MRKSIETHVMNFVEVAHDLCEILMATKNLKDKPRIPGTLLVSDVLEFHSGSIHERWMRQCFWVFELAPQHDTGMQILVARAGDHVRQAELAT